MIEDRERMLDEVLSETPPPGKEKEGPSDVGGMSEFAQLLIHYMIECDKEGVTAVHREGDESVVTLNHRLWAKAEEARDLAPPLFVERPSRKPGRAAQMKFRRKTGAGVNEEPAEKRVHDSFRGAMEKLREAQEDHERRIRKAQEAGAKTTLINPSVSDYTTNSNTINTTTDGNTYWAYTNLEHKDSGDS